MKTLFVYVIIAVLIVATVPPLRKRAAPYAAPVLKKAELALDPIISRVLNPVFRWSAHNEEKHYLSMLQDKVTMNEALPDPAGFQRFLAQNANSGRSGRDPWGSDYYLIFRNDSIIVGSPGPDLKRGTADDVLDAGPR